MTWVIGASSLFGNGVVISDVQVTFKDGSTADLVQKAYPIANTIVAGFSGSVMIGFRLLQSLSHIANPPDKPAHHAVIPKALAHEWQLNARDIFNGSPENEKKLGAKILLIGISPIERWGKSTIPAVHIIRFASPYFRPGIMSKPLDVCSIGSGSSIRAYKQILKEFTHERSSSMQLDVGPASSWGVGLAHVLSNTIQENPRSGISHHLHLFTVRLGRVWTSTNNTVIHHRDGSTTNFRMPRVAQSYDEFVLMTENMNANASCAIF